MWAPMWEDEDGTSSGCYRRHWTQRGGCGGCVCGARCGGCGGWMMIFVLFGLFPLFLIGLLKKLRLAA